MVQNYTLMLLLIKADIQPFILSETEKVRDVDSALYQPIHHRLSGVSMLSFCIKAGQGTLGLNIPLLNTPS